MRRRSKVGPLTRRRGGPGEPTVTESAAPTQLSRCTHVTTDTARLDDDTQRDDLSNSDVNAVTVKRGSDPGAVGGDGRQAETSMRTTVAMSGPVARESSTSRLFLRPEDAESAQQKKQANKISQESVADHDSGYKESAYIEASETINPEQNRSPNTNHARVPTSSGGQSQDRASSDDTSTSSTVKTLRREQKVFLTLTYIMVGYLICWMPFHVSFDIMAIDRTLVPERLYDVTYWLAYCNSAINPFLYNFSSPDFHRAFKKLLGRRT